MTSDRAHLYAGDGIYDWRGHDRCLKPGCGLPAEHPDHRPYELPAEVSADVRARLGERDIDEGAER